MPFSSTTGECDLMMMIVQMIMSIITGNVLKCLLAHCRWNEVVDIFSKLIKIKRKSKAAADTVAQICLNATVTSAEVGNIVFMQGCD